jgi:glycosyltransferase involved in cell wall biosynthesis
MNLPASTPLSTSPAISVVMPTYNANRFVGAAIESVLAQTFEDFEFIIVDDYSTDGSSELLRHYAERDSRIRVMTNVRNLDFVCSRNLGIAHARGAFIANMDSDDVAVATRLAEQYAFMKANPAVGVCGAAVILIDENDRELGIRRYRADDRELRARWFLFNPVAQPVTMIRKDVLDETGPYNPDHILADDLDLWFRIGIRHRLANLQTPLLKYRVHQGSATGRRLADMHRAAARVRSIARSEYGYRPSMMMRVGETLASWSMVIPPEQRILMFNWLRSRWS